MTTVNLKRSEFSSPIPRLPDPLITRIASLSLRHFRNYESARLEVSPAPVVLTGRNGAGKTNILEALSLLTPGRGLRRARIGEMDRTGAQHVPWTISAHLHGMQGEAQIGTGRDPESERDRRLVRIDGKDASQAALGRHMAMLWLTPQMEQLFNEGASAGRKFLDRLVYGFDPEHAARVNEYEYAMRERNRLLSEGRADTAWLDSLEAAMAETGCAIAAARLETAQGINRAVAASDLSFPKAHVAVAGFVEDRIAAGQTAILAEEALKTELQAGRARDAAAGRALAGIHRSELRVTHTGKNMPAEACSTGEQKAMLLSIVLAQARFSATQKREVPVLLLDEVAAHLDPVRRLELFEEICQIKTQAWMTGTDEKLFADLKGKAQYFLVDEGHLTG